MATFKSHILSALTHDDGFDAAIEAARKCPEAKGKPEKVRVALLECVAEKYGIPIVVSDSNRNKGEKVFDREHAKFETAKTKLRRLMDAIIGKSSGKGEGVEVPEHIAALAAKLAKACREYEQARKIANTAVAEAFAE